MAYFVTGLVLGVMAGLVIMGLVCSGKMQELRERDSLGKLLQKNLEFKCRYCGYVEPRH